MFINSPTYTCFELRGQYGPNRKEFPFENQLNPRLEKIASNPRGSMYGIFTYIDP